MGGEIGVESTPGKGSSFTVKVPYRPASAPTAPVEAGSAAAAANAGERLAGLTILVVEDNEINQLVLEEMLVSEGASAVVVDGGRQAIERLQSGAANAFDIVLMDIQMPDMDGYEATRRIRDIAPELPIGQTAHAMAEEREKCLAAGMVDHIAKPIDPDELVRIVQRTVDRTRWRRDFVRIEWDDSFSVRREGVG